MDSRLSRVLAVFDQALGSRFKTKLIGGFPEPEYIPASPERYAEIHFRENFTSSALHEAAHWCIAGPERRELHDFGYWYYPEGRTAVQQLEFERAEVRPQAIEWILSIACGQKFHLSRDNHGPHGQQVDFDFSAAVSKQAQEFCFGQLPARAAIFATALALEFGNPQYVNADNYRLELVS